MMMMIIIIIVVVVVIIMYMGLHLKLVAMNRTLQMKIIM
jgi:hypothetical protein